MYSETCSVESWLRAHEGQNAVILIDMRFSDLCRPLQNMKQVPDPLVGAEPPKATAPLRHSEILVNLPIINAGTVQLADCV